MYRKLAESRGTINIHIDVAGSNAGNLRMFEATGVGSCLITEHSDNIRKLFEPEVEVLTYRSKEELLDIACDLMKNDERGVNVATRGQKRTLKDHTLERMWQDIRPAFEG